VVEARAARDSEALAEGCVQARHILRVSALRPLSDITRGSRGVMGRIAA